MSVVEEAVKARVSEALTPEKLEAMKRRIGMPFVMNLPPFNRTASEDTIWHFAKGNGDDNPLWCEPTHGRASRWNSVIAPPLFVFTLAKNEVAKLPDDLSHLKGDPLRGIHAFYSGGSWEFFEPVFPGDTASMLDYLDDIEDRPSKFGGGNTFIVTHAARYMNGRGRVIAVNRRRFHHAARDKAANSRKEGRITRAVWRAEDLAAIDALHEKYARRGNQARFWEDVVTGDALQTIVKGPMTMTDIIGAFVGSSFGPYGMAPFRLDHLNRKRVPGFYVPNQWGIPEGAGSCHWDDWWAQRVGAAAAYDFGMMRDNWIVELLTAWMGDDGFLWKLDTRLKGFNYIGDAQWVSGKVVDKGIEAGRHWVNVQISMVNQRNEETVSGAATVLLPSKELGSVRLPTPPSDLPLGLDDLRRRLGSNG